MSSPESPPTRVTHNHLTRRMTITILPVGLIPVIVMGLLISTITNMAGTVGNAEFSRLTIGSVVALTLIAWLVSWLIAKRLAGPLVSLSQAMESFTLGNWDQRASVSQRDDTARLAELFNQIADEYRSTYQSLTLREGVGHVGPDQGISQIAWIAVQAESQTEMLEGALETLVRGFGLTYAAIYLIEQDHLREKRSANMLHSYQLPGFDATGTEQIKRPDTVDLETVPTLEWQVSKAIATRQAQVAESHQEVGLFEAAVPLLRAGQVIGALELLAFSRSGDARLGPFGCAVWWRYRRQQALLHLV